jgi:spermidine synthase
MTAPYLLVPIFVILLILYGISLLFSRLEVYSRSAHRKIWNYMLLATFLTAAILGVLMAIQINYKIEVPWTEKVLKWHVNFGIAMSAIGVFHLLWHWRYYIPVKKQIPASPITTPLNTSQHLTTSPFFINAVPFVIGFTSIGFQTLMIRELLGLFNGNELMVSLILFLWMILTGGGAYLGIKARIPDTDLRTIRGKSLMLVLTLFILPLFLFPLLYYLKSLLYAPGIEAGPASFSGFLLLILMPFCMMNGFTFTYSVRLLKPAGLTAIRAYAWESIGAAVSGLGMTLAILTGLLSVQPGHWVDKLMHPNEEIIKSYAGSAGRLTITRTGEQINVYENGVLTHSSGNTLVNEEMVHFAMSCHPNPENILVIGGALTGIQTELAKYECKRIDFTEPDPQIIRLAGKLKLLPQEAQPVNYIRKSPGNWLMKTDIHYDVILLMLPGPQNLDLNRFYATGFLAQLRERMDDRGILSMMLPGTANYVSDNAISTIGPIFSAAAESFSFVKLFPGENNYLIASGKEIRTGILDSISKRNISTTYLKTGYFDENLFHTRLEEMDRLLQTGYSPNDELKPRAFFGQMSWWIGQFPMRILFVLGLLALLILAGTLIRGGAEYNVMFILGAGVSGLEVILLFLLQMTAGSLYLLTGLLLAVFMAGLAAGSWNIQSDRTIRFTRSNTFIFLSFSVAAAILLLIANWLVRPTGLIGIKTILIFLISLLSAFSVGSAFAKFSLKLNEPASSGKLYAYDLLGAASGALIYPLAIVPLLGILPALGIISLTGIVSLGLIKIRR